MVVTNKGLNNIVENYKPYLEEIDFELVFLLRKRWGLYYQEAHKDPNNLDEYKKYAVHRKFYVDMIEEIENNKFYDRI